MTGVIDLLGEESDGTALVVDYKSDRLAPGADPEQLVARDYAVQRLLYALAVLREGALVVEVVHWFLERPDEPAVARYTLASGRRSRTSSPGAWRRTLGRAVRGQPAVPTAASA